MSLRLYDAHNHLQDARFDGCQTALVEACQAAGVIRMIVNGCGEADWQDVTALARQYPQTMGAAFGVHPWNVPDVSPDWEGRLVACLETVPSSVGEIGLDRWRPGLAYDRQEEVFLRQLALASERDLPVSIHCLRAWGRMYDLLRTHERPQRGFLLHSYGGPPEMVEPLANLGAYFSLPGFFARENKQRKLQTFRRVPIERLLLETDAPDQPLPETRVRFPLFSKSTQRAINHPANIIEVYSVAAATLEMTESDLADQVEENFVRLFSYSGNLTT